jgi:cyclic-di-GMP-binding biofilm dispersal mediator protein
VPHKYAEAVVADFTGKNILVLGGSRGIGAAIVRRFSKGGGKVGFTYAQSKNAAEALAAEAGAEAIRTDSADRDALIKMVASRGELDILVANAGTLMIGDPLTLEADAIDNMIDVNVRAPYHAAVEAARKMSDNGRIIVIGSVNGDRMPFVGGAAYALTKSAMQGMVRGLARDFGDRGITVNSIQPGPTNSDMNPADGPMAEFMHSFMAIKRHIRTDEIAELTAYIAGPNGAMITGAMHTIDGGMGA